MFEGKMAVTSSKKFFNEKSCLTSNKVQVLNARPLNVLVTVSVEAGTRDNLSSEKTSVMSTLTPHTLTSAFTFSILFSVH